jgi:cytochrome c-type biogenesis protein CcmH
MSLVAIAFAIWPLYKREQRLTGLISVVLVGVVALSSGLYYHQGKPEIQSGSPATQDMGHVVEALATRLKSNPNDLNGWKMLGRSYMSLRNYVGAIDAFQQAVNLESGQDAQTLVYLGEAKLARANGAFNGDISALFDSALAVDPNNMQGLFYGGLGAAERNDPMLAASRWERLLGLNPPPDIQDRLQQGIAEWRGEPAPATAAPVQAAQQPKPETSSPVSNPEVLVSARVALSLDAAATLQQDAMVFVMARDPAQPSPPIAVTRVLLSQLPLQVEFADTDSMMAGRTLSMFEEFELLARVAVSGQRTEQPGDWYGSVIVRPAESKSVQLLISELVP